VLSSFPSRPANLLLENSLQKAQTTIPINNAKKIGRGIKFLIINLNNSKHPNNNQEKYMFAHTNKLFIAIIALSSLTYFERADYNLPLFAFALLLWNYR
jgi:hypothetical protein